MYVKRWNRTLFMLQMEISPEVAEVIIEKGLCPVVDTVEHAIQYAHAEMDAVVGAITGEKPNAKA